MRATSEVHVINLRRSSERREQFLQRNAHLHCTIAEAVDGLSLGRAELQASGLFAPELERTYTAGAYGCALSHRELWQRAAAGTAPLTVAEDDAVFRGDFPSAAADVLGRLPAGWDFVLWGWNFDSSLVTQPLPGVSAAAILFDQKRLRGALPEFQALREPVLPLRLLACFGTPAYTLSPAGAARLLNLCFPLTSLLLRVPQVTSDVPNTGLDIAMNVAYPNLSAWACFPPLAVTPNDERLSTVQRSPQRAGVAP